MNVNIKRSDDDFKYLILDSTDDKNLYESYNVYIDDVDFFDIYGKVE